MIRFCNKIHDDKFVSHFNKAQAHQYLIFAISKDGDIKSKHLALLSPNGSFGELPDNFFAKLLNESVNSIDCEIVLLGMWDRYISGSSYKDGVLRTRSVMEPEKNIEGTALIADCMGWYLITTYYNSDGSVSHTTEQLLYVVCPGDCPPGDPMCTDTGDNSDGGGEGGGGSSGSGGDPEIEECINALSGLTFSSVSQKMGVEDCGAGPNTRIKCYTWKIYTVSGGLIPMYFVSREKGTQIFDGGANSWAFQNFNHESISKVGTEILYSASVESVSATPSLYKSGYSTVYDNARMHLSYTVRISAICDGLPIVHNKYTGSQTGWHVSE